ncbi:MAG: ROK family protein, partial [bacterium]
MAKYGYGIDIGGTAVKMGLFTPQGELLEKWEIRTNTADGGIHVVEDIAASINANIDRHAFDKKDILGIGMGVPGPVTASGLVSCVNLGWKDYPVITSMMGKTGLPVRCANDANCAALGETWMGSGRGHKNIVMITLGTGVGGGIILDGKILAGAHGSAGELGHIPVNPNETRLCNCGGRGCLEMYASANGNVRLANDILDASRAPSALRKYDKLNSKICWDL